MILIGNNSGGVYVQGYGRLGSSPSVQHKVQSVPESIVLYPDSLHGSTRWNGHRDTAYTGTVTSPMYSLDALEDALCVWVSIQRQIVGARHDEHHVERALVNHQN
eukprot:1331033-Amphidinium_carterae.1